MPPFSTRPRPAAPRASYMYNRHRTRVTGASVVSNAIRSVFGGAYFSAFCILRIFDPLCVLRIACCVLRTGQPSLTRICVLRIAYCVFTYPFLPALRTQYAILKPCQTVLRNTQKAASIRNWSIALRMALLTAHLHGRSKTMTRREVYRAYLIGKQKDGGGAGLGGRSTTFVLLLANAAIYSRLSLWVRTLWSACPLQTRVTLTRHPPVTVAPRCAPSTGTPPPSPIDQKARSTQKQTQCTVATRPRVSHPHARACATGRGSSCGCAQSQLRARRSTRRQIPVG